MDEVKPPVEREEAVDAEAPDDSNGSQSVTFPLGSYRDAAVHLRRPFAPNAVRFKLQTEFGGERDKQGKLVRQDGQVVRPPSGALVVAYIDARTVIDRLNMVCPHLWCDTYEREAERLLRCHLTIDSITRTDVGEGIGKAAYSDALKRAAVKFGVGVSLYAIPQVRLLAGEGATKLRLRGDRLVLSDDNLVALRRGYAKWLEAEGSHAFGEPLDHGDSQDATGDPLDPDAQETDAEASGELFDPETGELKDDDPGPKIRKPRLDELTKLVYEAPPWVTPQRLEPVLDELGVPPAADTLGRMKQLRRRQANELEQWLRAVPAEEPKAPALA